MKYLVYKNDKLETTTLSVEHLIVHLERKDYLDIKRVGIQGKEIARIKADNDIFTVYE